MGIGPFKGGSNTSMLDGNAVDRTASLVSVSVAVAPPLLSSRSAKAPVLAEHGLFTKHTPLHLVKSNLKGIAQTLLTQLRGEQQLELDAHIAPSDKAHGTTVEFALPVQISYVTLIDQAVRFPLVNGILFMARIHLPLPPSSETLFVDDLNAVGPTFQRASGK